MEKILWVCLGVTLWVGGLAAFLFWPAASAWRLHRRTGEKMRESVVELDRERKRGARMTDHRYDPKQFRRR